MSPFFSRKNQPVVGEGILNFAMNTTEIYAADSQLPCPVESQPVFVRFAQRLTCSTPHRRVRCKSVTFNSVRVATGHQIPCEWTYITLGCFLRTLTMTDRPRKDTDLSLFVGPYQPWCSSCISSPLLVVLVRGTGSFHGPQQKRLSYLDSISVKFGQWNGLTGHCCRIRC